MKHTKYILAGISLLTVVSVGVYYGFLSTSSVSSISPVVSQLASSIVGTAGANPDYICIKQVDNAPCTGLDNPPWNGLQSRVRTGTRLTQVAYYSVRIGCAEGWVGYVIGQSWGASGRRSADFPYAYGASCTVVETDTIAPDVNPTTN